MIRRIGEYISLELVYFVTLTSSCWLIPWQGEAEEKGTAGKERGNKREYTLTRQSEGEEVGIAGKGTGNKREWTLIWQGEAEEEGAAGKGRGNKREWTLTRQGEAEEEGISGEGTGNKREWTFTWQGEAEEEGIAGEGDENVAGVVQEAGLKNPAQWPSALSGAGHAGRLFGAFAGQLFDAGQLSGAG